MIIHKLALILLLTPTLALSSNKINSKELKSTQLQNKALTKSLLRDFGQVLKSKASVESLQKKVFRNGGKSVPALIKVMKNGKFPDKNRWVATMFLGRLMGKKSSALISKFLDHPNWVMRMASLKTLLALNDTRYSSQIANRLKDKSLIVKTQALENIRLMKLKNEAPKVWQMLYDKSNYYSIKKKKDVAETFKRTHLIKNVIKTIGELEFSKAKTPLLTMIKKEKYKDIYPEIDYALTKITGKKSPKGKITLKRNYWNKVALMSTNI